MTERPGRLRVVGAGGTLSEAVAGLPAVEARGQGGLLDVTLDPNFASNGLIYWSWDPVIGPSGMAFYTADLFPAWRGSLFVGGHQTNDLVRLTLDGEKIVGEERLLTDLQPRRERIRDVRQGPDGALYLLTDNSTGRLLKLVPKRLALALTSHAYGA